MSALDVWIPAVSCLLASGLCVVIPLLRFRSGRRVEVPDLDLLRFLEEQARIAGVAGVRFEVVRGEGGRVGAFAGPGRRILLTEGAAAIEDRDALRFAVLHELGHVERRDSVRGVVFILGWGVACCLGSLAAAWGGRPTLAWIGPVVFLSTFYPLLRILSDRAEVAADARAAAWVGDAGACLDAAIRLLRRNEGEGDLRAAVARAPQVRPRLVRLARSAGLPEEEVDRRLAAPVE